MDKKIAVIIVSYNVCQLLDECLKSVKKALQGIDGDIYVVDNRSQDHTVEVLQPQHPDVHFIKNDENVGFARANNQAIRLSQSEYVLLLNPDTVVYEPTIKGCLEFMDVHPEAGGAGVRMLNREGERAPESRRAIPTPWVSMLKMLGFTRRYYMSHLSWDEPGRIEVISGAYCLLRRKALDQVGLLDEDFFMYGEDIDLSYRLQFPLCPHVLSGYAHLLPQALRTSEHRLFASRQDGHLLPCLAGPAGHDGRPVAPFCQSQQGEERENRKKRKLIIKFKVQSSKFKG